VSAAPAGPSVARRILAGLVLLVAAVLAGGVAAADLTGALSGVGPDDASSADGSLLAPARRAAAAVGEASRAGTGAAACPVVSGGEESARLVMASATGGQSRVRVQRFQEGRARVGPPEDVDAATPLQVDLGAAQAARPAGARWRGEPVVVSRLVGGSPAAAGPCEAYPHPVWHVTGFDTTLESQATLHLVNPYLTDAVVRVTFATPEGASTLVRTDNVLVAAGGHRALDVTDLQPQHPELAATVEVLAGRVMAQGEMVWGTTDQQQGPQGRAMLAAVPGRVDAGAGAGAARGADTDTGATAAAAPGPQGAATGDHGGVLAASGARAGDRYTSWLVVHNPGSRTASFELSVTDPKQDAPALMTETGVPAGGVVRVDLSQVSTASVFAVAIDAVDDARLTATRVTAITTSDGRQDVSAAPLKPPATGWALAGARADAGRLMVANFDGEPAGVDVDAGAATPKDWTGRQVAAGGAASFPLGELDGDGPVPVRVDADNPVVVGVTRLEGGPDVSLWSLAGTDLATWRALADPAVRRDRTLPGRLPPSRPGEEASEGPARP
jgi:hypothetical protein